ncbi:MAG: 2-succinyl-6-hydroxy-2,4-cyclohexadiene-1-carboxylate synthase [Chloroflexota bacterium]
MTRIMVNGLYLNVEIGGTGEPLLLLHGFMGSSQSWAEQRIAFEGSHKVITLDLPGHGFSDSPTNPTRYQIDRVSASLDTILDQLELGSVHLLGYSMGGRVAQHFALTYPHRVRSLLLESTSPGLADPAERQARIASDAALAEKIEREGLEAFVAYWSQLPLFASQANLPAHIRADQWSQRLQNNVGGLANSLRGLSTGAQFPLWDRLNELTAPTLLIVGALDSRYTQTGQQMAKAIPTVQIAVVPNAGHNVHLEQPAVFNQLVLDHLKHASIEPSEDTTKPTRR